MLRKKAPVVAAAAAAILSVVFTSGAKADSPYGWAVTLKAQGCAPSRPAVAHYANQSNPQAGPDEMSPQPTDGPVPCGNSTGLPTVENKIEVSNSNTLFYEPALQGGPVLSGDGHAPGWGKQFGYAFSTDGGADWNAASVQVVPETYVEDGQVDNNIYVDHDSGRFFWYMYNAGNAQVQGVCGNGGGGTIAYSGDDGKTWAEGYDFDHNCSENPDVVTGHVPAGGAQPSGYQNVVYLCGDNTSSGAAATGTLGYSCSKSLNGGGSWLGTTYDAPANTLAPLAGGTGISGTPEGYYAGKQKDALDPYPQCAGQSSAAGADVQPLPGGILSVVVSCNSEFFLSESRDEGATWTITSRIPHGGTLRIDSEGNMYLVEVLNGASHMAPSLPGPAASSGGSGNSEILLSHSTDGGATWSPELNMVAPGVTSVGTWSFAQGTYAANMVGNVAVTYYGNDPSTPDGKNGYSDGYITQTRDALAPYDPARGQPGPLFWSGQVNTPGRPLLYNTTTDGNIGITVLDFNGGALSPVDGSAWGSWVQDCGPSIAQAPCTARYPHTNPANPDDGFAGRLAWPH